MQTKTPRIAHLIELSGKKFPIAASLAPNPIDAQKIVLIGEVGPDGEHRLWLISTATNQIKKEIWVSRSLKFASHSAALGWGCTARQNVGLMHRNMQTALALCMVLYGVSNALKCYKDFAAKYLFGLPAGQSFNKQLTVEL